MGAACPSCGIAVVPGYARCPKCHALLPVRHSAKGGTAVAGWHLPRVPAIAAGALVLIVVIVALARHHARAPVAPAAAGAGSGSAAAPATAAPTSAAAAAVVATSAPAGAAAPASARPDPGLLADALQRELQHEELWSTVDVKGDHVEVRSSSCRDAQMQAALEQAGPGFKAAGLTGLRCLEQSGVVVFTRSL